MWKVFKGFIPVNMSGLPPFLAFMGDTQLTKKKKTLENKTTLWNFSVALRVSCLIYYVKCLAILCSFRAQFLFCVLGFKVKLVSHHEIDNSFWLWFMLQAVLSKYGVENFIGSHFQTYFYQELIFKKFFKIGYFSFFVSNRSRRPRGSHSGRPCFNTFAAPFFQTQLTHHPGPSRIIPNIINNYSLKSRLKRIFVLVYTHQVISTKSERK